MTDIWSLPDEVLDLELSKLPSMVTWSRLEPMSRSADLGVGLQTLLADPLWLIGRQWQFGELRGEEGGTPVTASTTIEHGPLSRLRHGREAGVGPTIDLFGESVPLEARVEAETVREPSARIRAEAGLHLLRMLTAAGAGAARTPIVQAWAFTPLADGGGPLSALPAELSLPPGDNGEGWSGLRFDTALAPHAI